jgi:vacuolar-type H+-ATPase subunit I/STV1
MNELMTVVAAAKIYAFFTLIVIGFQLALAVGAPWGKLSMGGKFPGVYPKQMRIVAVFMGIFLALLALIVGIRAGWIYPEWVGISHQLIWPVIVINALGFLMNIITPSRWERIIWAPVTLIFLLCSVYIGWS